MADIDRRDMAAVMEEALRLALDGTDMLHCSFDIDCVDPREARHRHPKPGGLTYREARLACDDGGGRAPHQHGDSGGEPHSRPPQRHRRAGGGADRIGAGIADLVRVSGAHGYFTVCHRKRPPASE